MTKRKQHGGKRPGAGRPRKAAGAIYDSALAFLTAVARGIEPASPEQRVAAARAVLPYEQPKTRAPKKSPPPERLRAAADLQSTAAAQDEWRAKAEQIRARHGRKE